MPFRSVIVCRIVPGSEEKVGAVFGHYDKATRPQDLGVIGRSLLSLDGIYIHIVERNMDPKVSGQSRGLPAFAQIAEEIGPYVTPYPRNWKNPSDSVAQEFYSWTSTTTPPSPSASASANHLVILQRIKPGAEADVARIFGESDKGSVPVDMGVTGRWLHSNDDAFVHVMERTPEVAARPMGKSHHAPAFAKVMEELSLYTGPISPETWNGPKDSVAKEFYRWRAED